MVCEKAERQDGQQETPCTRTYKTGLYPRFRYLWLGLSVEVHSIVTLSDFCVAIPEDDVLRQMPRHQLKRQCFFWCTCSLEGRRSSPSNYQTVIA